MKTLVYFISFLLYIIFSLGCDEKKSSLSENNEPIIRITRCYEPVSSHVEYDVSGFEYVAPNFLTQYLDSIIEYEKTCMCYNKVTGFRIAFSSINDTIGKILIHPLPNVGVGNYKRSKGYICYKSHYFVCDGDIDIFPIDTIRDVTVKLFESIPSNAEIDDSMTSWRFLFNFKTKKLFLISRVECVNW